MIRCALPGDGQGRLALPGGYQMLGQTWQEAGAREVLEETDVAIEAASLQVLAVETTPDWRQNLLFCQSPPVTHEGAFRHDAACSAGLPTSRARAGGTDDRADPSTFGLVPSDSSGIDRR